MMPAIKTNRWVQFDFALIVRETEKAFLVREPDDGERWVPKSQIKDPEELAVGDTDGVLQITEWLWEKMEEEN